MKIQNFVTGETQTIQTTAPSKPTLKNRFLKAVNQAQNRFGNFFSSKSLQEHLRNLGQKNNSGKVFGIKRGGAQTRKRPTEYQLRALSELSYRSPNVAKSNVKHLQNKQDKKMLAKLLNKSTRKIRRRN